MLLRPRTVPWCCYGAAGWIHSCGGTSNSPNERRSCPWIFSAAWTHLDTMRYPEMGMVHIHWTLLKGSFDKNDQPVGQLYAVWLEVTSHWANKKSMSSWCLLILWGPQVLPGWDLVGDLVGCGKAYLNSSKEGDGLIEYKSFLRWLSNPDAVQ